jgi:hypothetical protein
VQFWLDQDLPSTHITVAKIEIAKAVCKSERGPGVAGAWPRLDV